MSSVIIAGDTSGTVTLQAPAAAGSNVINVPAATGTMAVLPTATGVLPESNGGTGTTTGYYGFKNRLINGAMMIDQRNAGASVTNSTGIIYTLDRWIVQTVGSSCVIQQVTGSTGNNKALRITGASGNTNTILSQKIEAANIYDCAGQAVTVSLTLSGSSSGSVSVRFLYPTATDNFSSTTEPVAGTVVNFTTTATTYTVTRTLDANANKGLWVVVERGATGAGVTWSTENAQLEKGSTATSFDYRPYGTELALCQRYLPCLNLAAGESIGTGVFSSASIAYCHIPFQVQARVSPTGAVVTNPTNISAFAGAGFTASAVSFAAASLYAGRVNLTVSGATTGQGSIIQTGAAGAQIQFTGCEL